MPIVIDSRLQPSHIRDTMSLQNALEVHFYLRIGLFKGPGQWDTPVPGAGKWDLLRSTGA